MLEKPPSVHTFCPPYSNSLRRHFPKSSPLPHSFSMPLPRPKLQQHPQHQRPVCSSSSSTRQPPRSTLRSLEVKCLITGLNAVVWVAFLPVNAIFTYSTTYLRAPLLPRRTSAERSKISRERKTPSTESLRIASRCVTVRYLPCFPDLICGGQGT